MPMVKIVIAIITSHFNGKKYIFIITTIMMITSVTIYIKDNDNNNLGNLTINPLSHDEQYNRFVERFLFMGYHNTIPWVIITL